MGAVGCSSGGLVGALPTLNHRLQQPELSQGCRWQQGTFSQEPAGGGTAAAPVGVSGPGELPLGPTHSPGPLGAGGAGRVRHPGAQHRRALCARLQAAAPAPVS